MPPKKRSDSKIQQIEVQNDKDKSDDEQDQPKQKKSQKSEKLVQKSLVVVNKQGIEVDSNIKLQLGDGIFNNKDRISISSWNINGIRAIFKKNDLINYFKADNFDIVCLNEMKIDQNTFISDNIASKFPKDYFLYLNCCKPPKSGYSGVAVLSKVKPIQVTYDIGIHQHDQEGRAITLEFDKFFLISCYVPNSGQKLDRLKYRTEEWDIDFQNYLNILKTRKPTILCGDLNVAHQEIDISNPKGNLRSAGFTIEERNSFTGFLGQGWIDTFRSLHPKEQKFSYFSARSNARAQNKGWRLDYFIVNQENQNAILQSNINNDVNGSDHTPVEILLDLNKL